jgi:hypothetical protein
VSPQEIQDLSNQLHLVKLGPLPVPMIRQKTVTFTGGDQGGTLQCEKTFGCGKIQNEIHPTGDDTRKCPKDT